MNTGYQIIDLKNNSLSSTPVTITGIYDGIESNYRKALLLANIVIDSVEKANVFSYADVDSTNYVFTVYGGTITVTDEDAVTYAASV